MKKYITCVAIGLLVVAVGVFAWQNFYDGGSLIDATGAIIYEEDAEIEELGRRLVALATGEEFTEEQIEQISELVAGLFWAVSLNSWNIEELKLLQPQIDELRLAISDATDSLEDDLEDLEDDLEDLEDGFEELQVHVEDLEYLIDSKGS